MVLNKINRCEFVDKLKSNIPITRMLISRFCAVKVEFYSRDCVYKYGGVLPIQYPHRVEHKSLWTMAVFPSISLLLLLLSWTAQQTLSNPMMTPGKATTATPRPRVPCEKTACTCEEVGCMYKVGALPADGFNIRGSTSTWTASAFLAKYEECKSSMKKEGNDIDKIKCPEN